MKYKLYKEPIPFYDGLHQVLYNRNIENIDDYLETTILDVESFKGLGEDLLKRGAQMLVSTIAAGQDMFLIIDADFDGYSSAALFINYLHDLFPSYIENGHLCYYHHLGKQHGLNDCVEEAKKYPLVVVLDAGSNDVKECEEIVAAGGKVLCIDHHLFEEEPKQTENYVFINNQNYSNYQNKDLCGCAVTWLFCKYIDSLLEKNYADNYLDLVACGLVADMLDITSPQTKALIQEGLKERNIHNPLIASLKKKNQFSLTKSDYTPSQNNGMCMTPIGVGFFISPFINAVTRSGSLEEKKLTFDAMLHHKAFTAIPSTKRGCKGQMETVVEQATRTLTNVKRHQDQDVSESMELLERRIGQDNMLDHKVLLFLLEPGEIAPNVAGLVANKLMHKYQRCTCVLTRGDKLWAGSMRGYSGSGLESFKDILDEAESTNWTHGHAQAAGTTVRIGEEEKFLQETDELLADLPDEAIYKVDYIWNENTISPQTILELADVNDFISTGIERPMIAVENIKLTEDKIQIFKGNTLRINTAAGVPVMAFGLTEEEIENLVGKTINIVGKANRNEYLGNITPQILIEEWEETESAHDAFWGF